MTEAPQLLSPVEPSVMSWRAEISGQVSVSASGVQDRLFDLWGMLPEGELRSEVEKWLTETLRRHLYEVKDIEHRLDVLFAVGADDVAGAGDPAGSETPQPSPAG